ncbi:MAG: arsenite methyltransferase [Spirochaetales bacterium]|nr:arsenite methyltransferase [Spirochaetales bacterium]
MQTAEEIKKMVRSTYGQIAEQSYATNATSCCGAGSCSTESFMLAGEDYAAMPGYVAEADLGLGCGIPTAFTALQPGERVLDLGSGAGNDVFIARRGVGPGGQVIGVDMTAAMIEKARANNHKLGYQNVEFRLGEIDHLPVESGQVDVIVSNCVLNLVPDKKRAFTEMFRVLAPGGRFVISDIVLEGQIPSGLEKAAEMYAGCISGAAQKADYLNYIADAGFQDVLILKEKDIVLPQEILETYLNDQELTAFRTSGVGIRSVTVSARKPGGEASEQSPDSACCGGGCC